MAAAIVVLAGAVAGGTGSTAARAAKARPNIVFVLTDDLAWNLVRYMPHVRQMERNGVTFTRYFVTDSLCCPSRSSIFTGRFPHNTKIFTNLGPDGGYQVFHQRHEERSTFATAIRSRGYGTSFMGKYLNGYEPSSLLVPHGWTDWHVAGNGYPEFNYNLNENGHLFHYARRPQDYLTDVVARKGSAFINGAADAHQPFALEIATFAPHSPFTPAPRDAADFPGLQAPRGPAFNTANTNPPRWLAGRPPLRPRAIRRLDNAFHRRAQAVEAVDDLIARLELTLAARGLADNTYIVFSSDNGFHLGEHRLHQGKMTAFDTDIRVPLIVVGPGLPKGKRVGALAQNVDLRPTFSRLAGAGVPKIVDGRSLVPWLRGHKVKRWRHAVLIEHHGPKGAGPDKQSDNPTSYEAIRLKSSVYVEYANGDREYYNLVRDPNELHNTYAHLSKRRRGRLHRMLRRLERCRGAKRCAKAAR
ncbi:MAG: sulfatase [Thermoleophilaceae bacterium]